MSHNTKNELKDLISTQDAIVRDLSHEILSIPLIQDSVFFGFALRWPHTYIAYLFEVLARSHRLPPTLHSWTPPNPDPELKEQLLHFHSSALIHVIRLPDTHRSASSAFPAAIPLLPELDTDTLLDLRARLLALLHGHDSMDLFASLVRDNPDAWLLFTTDAAAQRETELWDLPIPLAVDVAALRAEHARLVRAGVFPPMVQTIRLFQEDRFIEANYGGEIDMDFDVLARDPVTAVAEEAEEEEEEEAEEAAGSGAFPGFWRGSEIGAANGGALLEPPPPPAAEEDEPVFDFGKECVWCSAELLQPEENAAEFPDREVLRRLPCQHSVGSFCFNVAGKRKCPICSADV